jgi:hypothetical protein
MKKTIFALAAAICFPSASYAAETYCQAPGLVLYDGLDTTIEWVVTSVNARKTQKIGQVKPTRGCSRDFRPNGMILSRVVITPAKLGKFRSVNLYRLYYESEKLGTDEVAYKTTWESGGRISSAVVRIKIRVIGTAI